MLRRGTWNKVKLIIEFLQFLSTWDFVYYYLVTKQYE